MQLVGHGCVLDIVGICHCWQVVESMGVVPSSSAARPSAAVKPADKKDTEFKPVAVPEKSSDKPKSLALFLRKVVADI